MTLVYRDRTYCPYSDCADFASCSRRLTDSVKQAAELLRLPICRFAEQPNCFEAKKTPETWRD
jgi:hypothetical protein